MKTNYKKCWSSTRTVDGRDIQCDLPLHHPDEDRHYAWDENEDVYTWSSFPYNSLPSVTQGRKISEKEELLLPFKEDVEEAVKKFSDAVEPEDSDKEWVLGYTNLPLKSRKDTLKSH